MYCGVLQGIRTWHGSWLLQCVAYRSGFDQEDRLTNPLVDCLNTLKHLNLEAWRENTNTAQACDVSNISYRHLDPGLRIWTFLVGSGAGSGKFSLDPYPDSIGTVPYFGNVNFYKQGKNILKVEHLHISR